MTKKDELMLALLGRIAFPDEKIRAAVTRKKRNPGAYVRGYNACDGTRPVGEVARIVGVTPGTLVPILQEWERMGIIYEVESEQKGKYYRHLYQLEE